MIHDWDAALEADDKLWDQTAFNDLAHKGLMPYKLHPANPRVLSVYDGKAYLGVLPVSAFCSGHTFFVQHLYEVLVVSLACLIFSDLRSLTQSICIQLLCGRSLVTCFPKYFDCSKTVVS